MKKSFQVLLITILSLVVCFLTACSSVENTTQDVRDNPKTKSEDINEGSSQEERGNETMKIKIGDNILTATLEENSSAQALKKMLMEKPLTIKMSDYGNMEKVGSIGKSLPKNDKQITTQAGDIILYMGNSLVIYYDTNSWNFTKLGKINDVSQKQLKEILGKGNVEITLMID